jgi:hypothetical protein
MLFIEFLSFFIFFDHTILIDYFISPETAITFRWFLSEYLSLAATDWTAVVQACKELDDRNAEIVPSDPKISDPVDISEDEDYQHFKDHSPILSQKGTSTNPSLAIDLDPILLSPCEQVDSSKGETIMTNSDTSMPTSVIKEYADQAPSLNPEPKRPKLDRNCGGLWDTSVPSATNYIHQRDLKGQQQAQTDNADVSKESSDSEAVEELESSGSVYVETSLDKMMDCLTKFKYALQRLKCSHLLVTMDDSIVVENIISCYEQLEHLYEAMDKCNICDHV